MLFWKSHIQIFKSEPKTLRVRDELSRELANRFGKDKVKVGW